MVALLKQCCCGCSLKTGSIIIGILYVIGGLYIVVSTGIALTAINNTDGLGNVLGGLANSSASSDAELSDLFSKLQESVKLNQSTLNDLSWYLTANLVIRSIELILSILMLVGVVKDKPKFLPPWIVFALIILALSTIEYIVLGVQYAMHEMVIQATSHFFGLAVGICLGLYFIYVVYSHYRALQSETERPKYDAAPQNQI